MWVPRSTRPSFAGYWAARAARPPRRRPNRILVVKAVAGELRAGHRRHQVALVKPVPERAAPVGRVWSQVGLVAPVGAAGAAAQCLVRLKQAHFGALLGAGDRRGQSRDAGSDDRDRVHATDRTAPLDRRTVSSRGAGKRASWSPGDAE